MNRRALSLVGILTAFAAATNLSQDIPPKNQPTLRVETRLIEVNVVAQDSKGRAVTGLTRRDFKLFDNGREVPVDVFSAAVEAPASAPPAATLPPNTFSNRIQSAPPSVTVILLDGLNTKFEDQAWARSEVVRFLEELKPNDCVAIFLLSDRHYVLQTFTGDPQLLLTVLKRTRSRSPTNSANSTHLSKALVVAEVREEEAIEGFEAHKDPFSLRSGSGAEAEFLLRDRIERTTSALVAIGNYLAQFPGRKNLLWVSSAFPNVMGGGLLRAGTFRRELRKTSNALNNADMAVYPVDARGLYVQGLPGWQDASTPNPHWMPPVLGDPNVAACFPDTHGTMDELADDTGGRAYYNTNGLTEAMRSAVDDSHVNYTLGFYPHLEWDDRYHDLKVKVDRPGVHLRYRKGYYATPRCSGRRRPGRRSIRSSPLQPPRLDGLGFDRHPPEDLDRAAEESDIRDRHGSARHHLPGSEW